MRLPDLNAFDFSPLPPLDPPSHWASDSKCSPFDHPDPTASISGVKEISTEDDIWHAADTLGTLKDETRFLTWEAFAQHGIPTNEAPKPSYITEAGAAAFDAALQQHGSQTVRQVKVGSVVRSDALLRSLWQLALGWESALFPYDYTKRELRASIHDARASGCSVDSSQSLIAEFLRMGNAVRQLRAFVDQAYAAPSMAPARIAIASATQSVLAAVEEYIDGQVGSVRTLLQLQVMVDPSRRIVLFMLDLFEQLKGLQRDKGLVERLFARVEENEEAMGGFQDILLKILQQASKSSLESIERMTGISEDISRAATANHQADIVKPEDDDRLQEQLQKLPALLADADRALILEIQQNLSFMQRHHSSHPLANTQIAGVDAPSLEWGFEWDDIQQVEQKAKAYEQQLLCAIQASETLRRGMRHDPEIQLPSTSLPEQGTHDTSNLNEMLEASIKAFNTYPSHSESNKKLPSELHTLVLTRLTSFTERISVPSTLEDSRHIRPPLPLSLHLSIHPFLRVRHRLLSHAALHHILHCFPPNESLQDHLNLHFAFSLCGSGLFAIRLSAVLFSADIESAERKKGAIRTGGSGEDGMGLKLGTGERRQWPPASSEVRLALMGVLRDSWEEEINLRQQSRNLIATVPSSLSNSSSALPSPGRSPSRKTWVVDISKHEERRRNAVNHLSFSIRHIASESHVSRILDPSSIAALDFLRLIYEPPDSLRHFFPPRVLDLYDRMIGLWLRLLRVQHALGELFRLAVIAHGKSDREAARVSKRTRSEERLGRMRWRVTHLFTTLLSHFRSVGVQEPWTIFQDEITKLEGLCAEAIPPSALPPATTAESRQSLGLDAGGCMITPASLLKSHEATLETIVARLLLRKKQKRASEALEALCEDVLHLVLVLRQRRKTSAEEHLADGANGFTDLEEKLEKDTGEFVAQLRRLSEKDGEPRERSYFAGLVSRIGWHP